MKQDKFNDKLKTENDHFWENLNIKANQMDIRLIILNFTLYITANIIIEFLYYMQ